MTLSPRLRRVLDAVEERERQRRATADHRPKRQRSVEKHFPDVIVERRRRPNPATPPAPPAATKGQR